MTVASQIFFMFAITFILIGLMETDKDEQYNFVMVALSLLMLSLVLSD